MAQESLAAGYGACHWSAALACARIVVGALLAKDMVFRRVKPAAESSQPA